MFALCALEGEVAFAAAAVFPALGKAGGEYSLPLDDFGPGAFVEEVVDGDHGFYGVDGRVGVAFAEHGVVHLLWRRVFPIGVCVGPGD